MCPRNDFDVRLVSPDDVPVPNFKFHFGIHLPHENPTTVVDPVSPGRPQPVASVVSQGIAERNFVFSQGIARGHFCKILQPGGIVAVGRPMQLDPAGDQGQANVRLNVGNSVGGELQWRE